jgi:tRNA(Arg) A34 adenosine deaminase TadA
MESQIENYIQLAIKKAEDSVSQGGFPAGAVVVNDGKIIGEGISIGNKLNDPTSHGEIGAIREACKSLRTTNLSNAVLYASMQPCLMCLAAAMWASIRKIVFACAKDKVSVDYYGGNYRVNEVNQNFIFPIELVHMQNLEKQSLDIVHKWEQVNVI